MSDDVAEAIAAAYARLGDSVPVAVRSSAIAEDSADASFAGQQDTYLWVVGEDEVLEHVRRCWASIWSDRSIAYRHDLGIDESRMRMGVVVQRMVDARVAGVAMTLDPHNGDRSIAYRHDLGIDESRMRMGVVVQRMVDARVAGVAMTLDPRNGDRSKIAIESSFGLGESVVGGTVTPDSFLVDKVMLETVKAETSVKSIELVPDPSGRGVVERPIEPARQARPSLTPDEVKAVAALAKKAEKEYGCPQDVEWAIDDTGVVLLQSRPETVWSHRPEPEPRPAQPYSLGMGSLVETLVNPLASRRTADVDTNH